MGRYRLDFGTFEHTAGNMRTCAELYEVRIAYLPIASGDHRSVFWDRCCSAWLAIRLRPLPAWSYNNAFLEVAVVDRCQRFHNVRHILCGRRYGGLGLLANRLGYLLKTAL